jgi:hypothetical protein
MARSGTSLLLASALLVLFLPFQPGVSGNDPNGTADLPLVRLPTMAQAKHILQQRNITTPEQFQRWSGVIPQSKPEGDYWRLADGVMFMNYLQLNNGSRQIACWGLDPRKK